MPIDVEDQKMMMKVALTSMGSKAVGGAKEHFAEIAIEAVKQVTQKQADKTVADIDNIQLVKEDWKKPHRNTTNQRHNRRQRNRQSRHAQKERKRENRTFRHGA